MCFEGGPGLEGFGWEWNSETMKADGVSRVDSGIGSQSSPRGVAPGASRDSRVLAELS